MRFSFVGLEMGIAVGIGYYAGFWLDERFGTKPYLMLLMLLFGIGAAFKGLFAAVQRARRDEKRH